ncbi:hypothetical protein Ait01nite_024850 [Actinoplanes italicus]|uniref:hypothetical protein n=1 Tax=Actinoplanes italicus TaxID=113567 RepID=UPI0011B2976D|nr:hypothetical protein [Actinoplanes italicus]GIE29440.1 hypothetical protein Ait01nite_024850 [Actinoplanes italicus]
MNASGWVPWRPDEDFVPQLLAASRARRGLDCAGAAVDAADLRAACLAADEADPFGLRLAGARVTGALDPRTCAVPAPLQFPSRPSHLILTGVLRLRPGRGRGSSAAGRRRRRPSTPPGRR